MIAFSDWRESRRVCWTTTGRSESIVLAYSVARGIGFGVVELVEAHVSGWETAAGWLFVISAGLAWYTASAMMLATTAGKIMLPLGKYSRAANVPGRMPTTPVQLEYGEPGVKKGQ